MVELRCRNCDAEIDVSKAFGGVVKCAFCGSVFTLPKPEQDSRVLSQLGIGQNELDCCSFDRAYTAFSKAAEWDESEPEAYFGMALADFKVQYLRDSVNNRLQPVCHEIDTRQIAQSADFKRALSLATSEQRAEYARKAEEIDYIRGEFYNLSQSGTAYDCFICVKVTEEDGWPTADSADAGKIYNALTRGGYQPFYSEYEIGNRTGADYEAMILYALYVSKRMLVVCSNEEYLKTKWVKNEYTRFVSMIADDMKEKNSITFVFRGKHIEKLPGVRGKIQGIDFNAFDALDKIRALIDRYEGTQTPASATANAKAAREDMSPEAIQKMFEEFMAQNAPKPASIPTPSPAQQTKPAPVPAPSPAQATHPAPIPAPSSVQAKNSEQQPTRTVNPGYLQYSPKKDFCVYPLSGVDQFEYKGKDSNVVVPADKVKALRGRAFSENKKLISVILPHGVERIEEFVFKNCENLVSVRVADTVQYIHGSAFVGCTKLKEITVGDNGNYYFTDGCLFRKRDGGLIYSFTGKLPKEVIVTEGSYIPQCENIEKVSFAPGIERLDRFFPNGNTKITEIALPESLREIRGSFERFTALKTAVLPSGVTLLQNAFANCSALKTVRLPARLKTLGSNSFYECKALTEMEIPDSVTAVGDYVFKDCVSLKTVKLPRELKEIPFGAFYGCTSLEEVTIPHGVTELEGCAFAGCSALKSVVLPDCVTDIGAEAFFGCEGLQTVTLNAKLQEIGNKAFAGCRALKELALPNGLRKIGAEAFAGCTSITYITVPKSVQAIGYGALKDCKKLTDLTLPFVGTGEQTTGLWMACNRFNAVFRNDNPPNGKDTDAEGWIPETLKNVTITGGTIERGAFHSCYGFNLTVRAKKINHDAFDFTAENRILNVILGEEVQRLAGKTGSGGPSFQVYKGGLPVLIRCMHARSFATDWVEGNALVVWNCNSEKARRVIETKQFVRNSAFSSDIPQEPIARAASSQPNAGGGVASKNAPKKSEKTKSAASAKSDGEKSLLNLQTEDFTVQNGVLIQCAAHISVYVPEGVVKIARGVCQNQKEICKVVIPDGVKEIEEFAFCRCQNLEEVILPKGIVKMGSFAFHRSGGFSAPSKQLRLLAIYCGDKKPLFGLPKGWDKRWRDKFRGFVKWNSTGPKKK